MIENKINILTSYGVEKNIFDKYDILFLPENIESTPSAEKLYTTLESTNLCKIFKESNLSCANSYDLNLEANHLDRRSHDLWLGVIWIMNNVTLPFFISLFIDWLKAKLSKGSHVIHMDLTINKKSLFTQIKYVGEGETLIKILNSLKDDNDTTN